MNVRLQKKAYYIPNFYLFIVGVFLLKLVLMGLFSSDYQNELFMRFINGFLTQIKNGNLVNPYEYYKKELGLFPYPPMMLLIEIVGGVLSSSVADNLFLRNLFFKVPILFFDCLGMYFLMKMFPGKRKYIAVLYFASPIIIYSSYMHGQLDIIPTTFLTGALVYLTVPKHRSDKRYILFLTAAIACKFHILAVVPILFLFSAKRDGWRKAIRNTAVVIVLLLLCVLPFWSQGFLWNVVFNSEQSILTKVTIDFQNLKIFVPVLAILLIYLNMFTISKVNRDLLYSFCGILFSVFLVLVPPMPGWYVWIVPFITIFFIDIRSDRYLNLVIYALLNGAYLLYFLFAHKTQYVDLYLLQRDMTWFKTSNPLFINGIFTCLTALLVYSIFMMYQSGVASNSWYRRGSMPFTIGISGDSGSGKSTLLSMIEMVFGKKELLFIEGDGDHKWERGDDMWKKFTHLNPKSNYLYRQAQDLSTLRAGQSIVRVDYDHDSGRFTNNIKIRPKPYIVLCGLHSLYLPQVRNNLDLKIYMDVDETLRRYWKIQRDVAKRGYSKEKILEQIAARIPDAEKYIYPQKKYADIIISYYDANLKDCMVDGYKESLSLRATLGIEIDLEDLIYQLHKNNIQVQYEYDNELKTQTIVFGGKDLEGKTLPIGAIAEDVVPHLDEIINHPLDAEDDLHGILEILLLLVISRKLQGDDIHV